MADPSPLTPEELRELERLEREATRDWSEAARDNDGRIFDGRGRLIFMSVGPTVSESEHVSNLVLAVALRNAAPRLLSELAALHRLRAIINDDGSLTTDEHYESAARDAMDALEHLGKLYGMERELAALREENERLRSALADTGHSGPCKYRMDFDGLPCSCGRKAIR